jgi:hypothetical protein
MRRVAIGALLGGAVFGQPVIQDTPYPEAVALRRPYEGVWPSNQVPSAWSEIACSNVSTTVLAFNCDRDFNPCALTICEQKDRESITVLDPIGGTIFQTSLPSKDSLSSFVFYGNGNPFANGAAQALAADSTTIYSLNCDSSSSQPSCTFTPLASHSAGPVVNDFTAYVMGKNADTYAWITGTNGTQAVMIPGNGGSPYPVYSDPSSSYNAMAFSTTRNVIALGNDTKLVLLDASAPPAFPQIYSLWVTNITAGWGAPIDDVITTMAFDDNKCYPYNQAAVAANSNDDFDLSSISCVSGNGTLYIGNPTALNILYPDLTVIRIDGMGGLPYGNITSIAISSNGFSYTSPNNAVSRPIYIGTQNGLLIFDPYGTQDVKGQAYSQWVTPLGFGYGENVAAAGAEEEVEIAVVPRPVKKTRGGQKRKLRRGKLTAEEVATGAIIEHQPIWRYLHGPRWLPSSPDDKANSFVKARGVTVLPAIAAGSLHIPVGRNQELTLGSAGTADVAFVATSYGLTTLQMQAWKLSDKATVMEEQLPPHLYRGQQINDCNYPGFGQAKTCVWAPGANDGLWTSLLVAAESFRFAVTKDPAAAQTAWNTFLGMKSLGDVTGISGLIARGAVGPEYTPKPNPGHDGWVASNASGYEGWYWMCDASSDEVSGHEMAYGIVAQLVAPYINYTSANGNGNATAVAEAADTLLRLAVYIVSNNFTLVDYTGKPTTWGHWEPALINDGRTWSDGRGINSMQILGLITAALRFADPASNEYALLLNGLQYLAVDNKYALNLLNLRIDAPCDVNYSDDELENFASLAFLFNWRGANATSPAASQLVSYIHSMAVKSLQRSFSTGVYRSRSDLWSLIYLYAMGQGPQGSSSSSPSSSPLRGGLSPSATLGVSQDVVWNMRTWAPELTDWPMDNSQRQDIIRGPNADRFGTPDEGTVVLPMNERSQGRWNGDPFGTLSNGNGGNGYSEADPGVFLMPYWMSRWIGVLSG